MKIHKYHSCENTFIVVDYQENIKYDIISNNFCNKYNADGLVVFKNDPVQMIFYNRDGSKAGMCGNGIRVLMHYLYDRFGIYSYLDIKTDSGIYKCEIIEKTPFISSVSLGIGEYVDNVIKRIITIDGKDFEVTLFELGVKHAIILSNNLVEDEKYLKTLFDHSLFNQEFNVNLVKPLNNYIFEIITYEKGVGITKSCGTGAAASGYVLYSEYDMEENLIAVSPGGVLKVDIIDEIVLIGESTFIDSYEEIL